MAKNYCYVIVNKENGKMLIEDCKLPIYWNKAVCKERQVEFNGDYVVHRLELSDIESLIIKSSKA